MTARKPSRLSPLERRIISAMREASLMLLGFGKHIHAADVGQAADLLKRELEGHRAAALKKGKP